MVYYQPDPAAAADTLTAILSLPADLAGGADVQQLTEADIPLADSGAAADTLMPWADTAAATDVLLLYFTPSDTAGSAETLWPPPVAAPVTETVAGADVLLAADAVTFTDLAGAADRRSAPASAGDAAAAGDAVSVTAVLSYTDQAGQVEGLRPLADVGGAADRLTVGALAVPFADSGAAADTLMPASASVALADAGAAREAINLWLERGAAADRLRLANTLSFAEQAAAAEDAAAIPFSELDAAAAAELLSAEVAAAFPEQAAAADAAGLTDPGAAAEALHVSLSVTPADAAAAAETLASQPTPAPADAAAGTDDLTSVTAFAGLPETAAGAETLRGPSDLIQAENLQDDLLDQAAAYITSEADEPQQEPAAALDALTYSLTLFVPQSDLAAAADLIAYITCDIPFGSDLAAAGDGLLSAEFPVYADAAAAADILALNAGAGIADQGAALTDAVPAVTAAADDQAGAAETVISLAAVPVADTAAGTDTPAASAAVPVRDPAAAADAEAPAATVASLPDCGSAAETLVVNVLQSDQAAAADTLSVTTVVPLADKAAAADLTEKTPFTAGGAAAATPAATLDITLDRDIADGDTIAVAWGTDSDQTVAAATDTAGQPWTFYNLNITGRSCGFFIAGCVQGATAGDTITITWSAPAAGAAVICGIPAATRILAVDAAAGTGSPASATPAETTGPLAYQNEICLGVIAADGAGGTSLDEQDGAVLLEQDGTGLTLEGGGTSPAAPSWPQMGDQQYISAGGTWVTAYSMLPGSTVASQTLSASITSAPWGAAVLTFYYEIAQDLAAGAERTPDVAVTSGVPDRAAAAELLVLQKTGTDTAGAADTTLTTVTSAADEAAAVTDEFSYVVSILLADLAGAGDLLTSDAGPVVSDTAAAGETDLAGTDAETAEAAAVAEAFSSIVAVSLADLAGAAEASAAAADGASAADTAAAGDTVTVPVSGIAFPEAAGVLDGFAYITITSELDDIAAVTEAYDGSQVTPPGVFDAGGATEALVLAGTAVAVDDTAAALEYLAGQNRLHDAAAVAESLAMPGAAAAAADAVAATDRFLRRIWVYVPVAGPVHGGSVTGPVQDSTVTGPPPPVPGTQEIFCEDWTVLDQENDDGGLETEAP